MRLLTTRRNSLLTYQPLAVSDMETNESPSRLLNGKSPGDQIWLCGSAKPLTQAVLLATLFAVLSKEVLTRQERPRLPRDRKWQVYRLHIRLRDVGQALGWQTLFGLNL